MGSEMCIRDRLEVSDDKPLIVLGNSFTSLYGVLIALTGGLFSSVKGLTLFDDILPALSFGRTTAATKSAGQLTRAFTLNGSRVPILGGNPVGV